MLNPDWMTIQNPKITENQKKKTTSWKPKQYSVRVVQPFCYCRPHYFYLYEVRPPMSSSYIYEIGLIKEKLLPGSWSWLIPVSTSLLPGWIRPFPHLVTAWELGGLTSVVTVMFVVRMSRSQRLQASSATRSGRRGGVSERASDWGGEIRGLREVRLSLPVNVQRNQVRLRSFHQKCRFEEGRACGFVFLVVYDPSLHLGTMSWFLTSPCFSGLSPGQVWLKYLVTAGNTPWLLWQQLIYK